MKNNRNYFGSEHSKTGDDFPVPSTILLPRPPFHYLLECSEMVGKARGTWLFSKCNNALIFLADTHVFPLNNIPSAKVKLDLSAH